jgi:hypothetical protein
MTSKNPLARQLARLEGIARAQDNAREERIRQALANDPDGRARRLLVGVLAAYRTEAEMLGILRQMGVSDPAAVRSEGLREYEAAHRERGTTPYEHCEH